MTLPRLARAGCAPRTVRAALASLLCTGLLLSAASPASAVTREQATSRALAALGSQKGSAPVVVFRLPKPLRAGTRVTQAGTKKLVGVAGAGGAFFFYEDSRPSQPYPHPGRVVLVGARSGKVRISRTITRAPLVNRKLPAFLASSKRYRSSKYRVFDRSTDPDATAPSGEGTVFANPLVAEPSLLGPVVPEAPNSPPKAHPREVIVKQDRPKTITLTGSDDDEDLLLFEIVRQPDHGTLTGQPPEVTYTPDPGYLGRDDFHFKTNDDEAQSNSAKVSITVVGVGAPPAVATSGGCTGYAERGAAVAVDGGLMVSDPDDTLLDSARVRIAANFVRGDDLLFTDQNGISGSYDDTTGVLALTGTASVAAYESALRTVSYRNLAAGSPDATKDVEFTVNDAGSDSAPATKQVCISNTGPNRRPIGETSEGALDYIENDGPLPVDAGFVAQDTDSAELSGATIQFTASQGSEEEELSGGETGGTTSNFAPGEDELAFTDQNGITGSYNDVTGTMSLSGTASVADYEAAIRSVTYENSSERPSDLPRALRFQVADSTGATSIASARGILVTPVNDAPVTTTSEGSLPAAGDDPVITVDAELGAIDVDDDNLEAATVKIASGLEAGDELAFTDQLGISGSYDGQTGVLTLTGTAPVADYEAALRTVEYRHPGGNPAGSKAVEFTVNDGDLDSPPAARTIEANDAPVLDTTEPALSYAENAGPVAVDPGITASDADSPTLAGASVQITENLVPGEDELAFTDQNGITGFYDEETNVLFLTGSASVADYEAALRSVTYANDSENPSPATRTVSFRIDDGEPSNNASDPVTRDVEVTPVNDAPVVATSAGSTAYTEGDPAAAVDSALTVEDVDHTSLEGATVRIASGFESGDELVFVDQLGIAGVYDTGTGVLTLTGTASVTDYEAALRSVAFRTTAENPSASRTVEFEASDGEAASAAAAKSIDIAPAPPL